jgi:hypothetical protein
MKRIIWTALMLSPFVVLAAPTDQVITGTPTLGRLFFTPAQRAALDEARQRGRVADTDTPATEGSITFHGYVKPSDGNPTVWLNGQAVTPRQLPPQVAIIKGATGVTAVTVQLGKSQRRVQPKVGQRVDLGSGKVSEASAELPANSEGPGESVADKIAPGKDDEVESSENQPGR